MGRIEEIPVHPRCAVKSLNTVVVNLCVLV